MCQHELAVTTERADLVRRQLQQTNLELAQLQRQVKFLQVTGIVYGSSNIIILMILIFNIHHKWKKFC